MHHPSPASLGLSAHHSAFFPPECQPNARKLLSHVKYMTRYFPKKKDTNYQIAVTLLYFFSMLFRLELWVVTLA
jgi:hypothetical protein